MYSNKQQSTLLDVIIRQHEQERDAPQDESSVSLNPITKQCIKLLERHYRAVKGSVEMLTVFKNPSLKAAACMVEDAELLLDAAKRLYSSMLEAENKPGFKINLAGRVSLAEIIKQQNHGRGLEPLPLETDLLLMRVKQGGHSGQYLADAFFSTYRNTPFKHSLNELIRLDVEGFRLFHEILHIRHISGWNDDALYQIEQDIKAIIKGGVK